MSSNKYLYAFLIVSFSVYVSPSLCLIIYMYIMCVCVYIYMTSHQNASLSPLSPSHHAERGGGNFSSFNASTDIKTPISTKLKRPKKVFVIADVYFQCRFLFREM